MTDLGLRCGKTAQEMARELFGGIKFYRTHTEATFPSVSNAVSFCEFLEANDYLGIRKENIVEFSKIDIHAHRVKHPKLKLVGSPI